ncbi:ferric reduction oxidase 2-like isoform X2 [Aristolochia californica]|uniref:ferric reduction oxidase 2-like isoform X2 n=1 Tax=Aristolochia californica TaxID=171875 RepID=UPI0035DC79D8
MVIPWAVKTMLGLIFLGYLIIWVLTPTHLWCTNWVLVLHARTDTKYFGWQGVYMLIYTFPVLLIAVFACLYLHLTKNGGKYPSKAERKRLAAWKRPVLLKGSLGVVSTLELIFLSMFLALLVWCFSNYLSNDYQEIEKGVVTVDSDGRRWVQKLRGFGLYLGVVGNISCGFLFYPVTRGSSILPLVGLTSEGSIKYHIWVGHITMIFFTAHGLTFLLYWAITNDLVEVLKWDKTEISNVAGEIALVFGLALWITAIPRLRRKMFELFFYTHQLYALFMFFYILHTGFTGFTVVLPGFYLFLIDRYLRFLQSRQKVRLVSARLLPCETLELNFSKSPGLNYCPSSIVFINVPSISSLQWHPFTINSNSNLEADKLSVVIKKEGTWTAKLYEILASPSTVDRLEVSLEGPYGPVSVDFLRHDSLVMVAGGSGITPMMSIIRELIFRKATLNCPTPRILLLCAFKHSADLTMLELLLPASGVPINIVQLQLEIKAFVTREKEPSMGYKNQVRTICFKPKPTDMPFSAVLGPHSWLWLGAIISTSFVLFLIIMGIIGRYYIYPIDKNTYEVFSTSSRAVLNMLVICAVIIGIASIATLWNKRQNAREGKQIQNIDAPTPTTSLSSWANDNDIELESFPQQHNSLMQNTQVHFGLRPDLKKMLLEYEGSSTGVLVSGPSEMRHEVAVICSSSSAGNLHYEAISFNW